MKLRGSVVAVFCTFVTATALVSPAASAAKKPKPISAKAANRILGKVFNAYTSAPYAQRDYARYRSNSTSKTPELQGDLHVILDRPAQIGVLNYERTGTITRWATPGMATNFSSIDQCWVEDTDGLDWLVQNAPLTDEYGGQQLGAIATATTKSGGLTLDYKLQKNPDSKAVVRRHVEVKFSAKTFRPTSIRYAYKMFASKKAKRPNTTFSVIDRFAYKTIPVAIPANRTPLCT